MAVNVTLNGTTFSIPQTSESGWGDAVTAWIQAVSQHTLQKTGGSFPLTSEVDFGSTFGAKIAYLKSQSANPAALGVFRLANGDSVSFRNLGNTADLALKPNATTDGVLSYGGVDLSGVSLAQTLTNKTISGASNTFTNISYGSLVLAGGIVNTDISATAAIAYSKLNLAGSILNTDIVSLAASKLTGAVAVVSGGTGATTPAAAFDALSPTTTKGDIAVRGASSNVRLPIGSDGQVPVADSTATNGLAWKTLQQGAKNYLVYNNFENNSATGWSLFNTTLTGVLPTGSITAGAASLTTFAPTATNPLAGTYSLALGNASANLAAGQGVITDPFTIDREDRAKMLSFKFAYELAAGTGNFSGTSASTWAVYLYDVANSLWVQPAGVYNLVQSSGVGTASGTFQTAANATQYRLALVCINATTGGSHVINLDDFSVGPQALASGPAMSDWVSYGPLTIGGSITAPTKGTVVNDKAWWRREGDSVHVRYEYAQSAAGTAGSGTYLFPLPAGLSADLTKVDASPAMQTLGAAQVYTGTTFLDATVSLNNATNIYLIDTSGSVIGGGAEAPLSGTTVRYAFEAIVPIAGWSSNSVQSSDVDNRVCSAIIIGNPQATYTANTPIIFPTVSKDTHAAYSASTGQYTAPISGFYQLSGFVNSSVANGSLIQASIGGAAVNPVLGTSVNSGYTPFSGQVYANAGQTIDVRCSAAWTSVSSSGGLSITRVSGPAVVTATETVAASYWASAAQATANQLNFDQKEFDTHSAVTTGAAWKFTAPVSGTFNVNLYVGNNTSSTNAFEIYKNGAAYKFICYLPASIYGSGSGDIKLLAGDYIDIRPLFANGITGSASLSNQGASHLEIKRVGN